MTRRTATSRAAIISVIRGSCTISTAVRITNMMISLVSCRQARIRPYMLFTSEVMLLWITEVSAFR